MDNFMDASKDLETGRLITCQLSASLPASCGLAEVFTTSPSTTSPYLPVMPVDEARVEEYKGELFDLFVRRLYADKGDSTPRRARAHRA